MPRGIIPGWPEAPKERQAVPWLALAARGAVLLDAEREAGKFCNMLA